MADSTLDLLQAAANAALPGTDVGRAAATPEPREVAEGWDVVTRADGLRVRMIAYPPGATEQQKQAARDAVLNADLSDPVAHATRLAAKALINQQADQLADALRAVVELTVTRVNNPIAARLAAEAAAVAAATTLQNLQSRWASAVAATPCPSYTLAQAKAAVLASIDSGSDDS